MATDWKPDPARGVFETILVLGGEPVALEAHLARLAGALADLYGAALPASASRALPERAAGLGLGRLRLTAIPEQVPQPGELGWAIEAGEVERSLHFPRRSVSLSSHPTPGGLGRHKWTDRSGLPRSAEHEAALLVDRGEVLEAARANVFAVRDGALFTPPLDGRILPGVTRATLIELARKGGAEVTERPLTLAELQQADEVVLTSSIRGIERAGAVDGARIPGGTPLADQLQEALRTTWGSVPTPARA